MRILSIQQVYKQAHLVDKGEHPCLYEDRNINCDLYLYEGLL